jgi:hypothetical protein
MTEGKKNRISDVDGIEMIGDISGEVEWTNDELRDALRADGIDPDKLVKNVLRRVKELNSNIDKFDLARKQPAEISGESSEPVAQRLGTVGNRENPRVEECRKMLIALKPAEYQTILYMLRRLAGQHKAKKEEKAVLLVHEAPGRKFRDE